jgi:signal transduction histidine kinase
VECGIDTDQLISVLSHDVSNLASALAGVFEFIINEDVSPDSQEMADFLSMGQHCSKDLLDAVGLIVDLYRLRAGVRKPSPCTFRVHELIDYALGRVAERARDRDITLEWAPTDDADAPADVACGDVALLRRAVVALLVHAIRATARNGVVQVNASQNSESGTTQLAVSVTDEADALFADGAPRPLSALLPAPPKSGPRKGVTLDEVGLAFCEMMALAHGGCARVVSMDGRGNTLSFTVPGGALTDEECVD